MIAFGLQGLLGLLLVSSVSAAGPATIPLLTAESYTILAKSGISTVPQSVITGDIGVSPASQTALTGFSLTVTPAGTSSTSSQVVGNVFAADYTSPTPLMLTQAVLDMQTAFIDGKSRLLPDSLNLAAGLLTSRTLAPGLYKWTSGVTVTTALTFSGSATDIWILQIRSNLLYNTGAQTILAGGALSKNIFWIVSGSVSLNAGSLVQGVILSASNVALVTGASVNGRILAQTAVTLQKSTVKPV